jgi:steroid delta-isomerase-like uncharacterized protein
MHDPREVVGRWLDAFNAHDEQAIRAVTASDATITAPPDLELEGQAAVVAYAMAWARAFPDAVLNVHHETAEGNTVVQEFTFEGTHRETLSGPGGDVPATNKRIAGRASQSIVVGDGVVSEFRLYFDQVDVMTQLGVISPGQPITMT